MNPKPPQSGGFRRFSLNSFSQCDSIASPDSSKNRSKSPRFEVEDFKKSGFWLNQGKNGVNPFDGLTSILTKSEQKSDFLKRILDSLLYPLTRQCMEALGLR